MTTIRKLSYAELEVRLLEAEDIIGALRHHEVDAIVGEEQVAVVRLREVEEALARAREELEERVEERTAELTRANQRLEEVIAAQEHAQRQLEQYTSQLRDQAELLDLAHDMIFVHDMDGKIVFWNRGAENTYGWKREEALGQLSHELLQTRYSEPLLRTTAEIIRTGWWEGEVVHTARDGRKLTVASRWALRRDHAGQPTAILEIDNDITRRKEAEREIEADRQQLASLTEELMLLEERQRRQIAATLHDSVGQSLIFAKRELGLLQQKVPPEVQEQFRQVCDQIADAIQRARDLTFELSPSTLYAFGLQAAVEELAGQFAESAGFTCRVDGLGAPVPLAEQVRTMLYRSVRELLVNVVKHAGAASVVIAMARDERNVMITVRDDGKGFDPSVLNAHPRERGFGLFSVRERLTHIGGKFTLESAEGQGTTVTLTAPLDLGQQVGRGFQGHTGVLLT
jgi:PAS domain S-box-containing protein